MNRHDDSLEPRLQSALDQLKPFPPREARTAAHARSQFLAQANNLRADVPVRSFWRQIGWSNLFPQREQFRFAPIVALILSLALAVGGSSAVVYASQDALPDDTLYAIKLLSEDVHVSLTADAEARANLMLDLASRRVSELVATGSADASVLARQQAQIAGALQIAAGLNDAQMNQVLARTRDVIEQGLQTMDAVPELSEARAILTAEHEFAQTALNDQAGFRKRFRAAVGETTPTIPISGTRPASPPRGTPSFSSTLAISETLPVPPPRGTPPFTSTLAISGTWSPSPFRGTPPFTSTFPISGTWSPPPFRGTPPFTSTFPISGTWSPPPRGTPPFALTVPLSRTWSPPSHPTEWRTLVAPPQPKSTLSSGSTPQPKSTPAAPPPQPPSKPTGYPPPLRGSGK